MANFNKQGYILQMKTFFTSQKESFEINCSLITNPSRIELGQLNLWINQQEGGSSENKWNILPSNRLLTLLEKKRCLGLVAFSLFQRREKSLEIKIQMVWTHPQYRNVGLGGKLSDALVQSISGVDMEVSEMLLTGSAKSNEGDRWLNRLALSLGKNFKVVQATDFEEEKAVSVDSGVSRFGLMAEDDNDLYSRVKPRRKK